MKKLSLVVISITSLLLLVVFVGSSGAGGGSGASSLPPNVTLNNPINYYNATATNITFNFTVTDDFDVSLTCNLTINNIVNMTNIAATNGSPQINITNNFNDEIYYWNVTCLDSLNNTNTSVTRKFTVDTVAPITSISGTSTSSINVGQTVYIWANWTDATTGVKTIELIVNGIVNKTNNTGLTAGLEATYNFSYVTSTLQIGATLNFTINATDYAGNENLTALLQVAVVDDLSPNFILISQIDGHNSSNTNVTLQFNVTDNYASTVYCNITVDGVVNTTQNDTSITSNTYKTFTTLISGLSDSTHYWNVTCWDSSNNKNISATRKFSVDTVSPIISNLRNTSTTNENSYIEFDCNENCNYSISWYNSAGLVSSLNNNTFATSHKPYLSSLTNSTTYFVNLSVFDKVGNKAVNNTFNFTTAKTTVLDTIPPGIELNTSLPSNMTNNTNILLSANFSDLESGFSGTITLNEFSDGAKEKNLEFNSAGNQTVYLKLSKNVNIITAKFILDGKQSLDISKYYNISHERLNYTELYFKSEMIGNQWINNSVPGFRHLTWLNGTVNSTFSVNHNNNSKIKLSTAVANANYFLRNWDSTQQTIFVYNHTSSTWKTIYDKITDNFPHPGGQPDGSAQYVCLVRDFLIELSNDIVSNGKINISYFFEAFDDSDDSQAINRNYVVCNGGTIKISESTTNWASSGFVWFRLYSSLFPLNVSGDIGNNSILDWNQTGELKSPITSIDLSSKINSYLDNCNADSEGNCLIPLTLYSKSAGIINISNIDVEYQGNNSCEICIASDGVCGTEWTIKNVTNNYSSDYLSGNCSYSWNTSNYNDGIYNISLRIKDTAYNTGISSKKITLDRNTPIFNYLYPYDNGAFTVNNTNPENITNSTLGLTFWYRVDDLSSIANCSLIFNDKINNTATPVQKNNYERFNLNISTTVSSTQYYNWSIACIDVYGHKRLTDTRRFTTIVMSNFSGETTDLGAVNLSKVDNLTFEQISSGKIKFSDSVNLSGISDINKYIKISYNKVEIDTSVVPVLNKSATLSIYNLTYGNTPRIMRNNISCPDTICKIVNYSNGTLTFNVTQFSVYTTEDAPADSGSSDGGSSGGSSSGGGGGSSSGGGGGAAGFICNMDWQCGEWSGCLDGLQTRQCDFVKVSQHWQEIPCPEESKPPVKSQTCEVKEIPKAQPKPTEVKEINQEAVKPKETNQSQITGMAIQEPKQKSNYLIAFAGTAVLIALTVFLYFKFFRAKT